MNGQTALSRDAERQQAQERRVLADARRRERFDAARDRVRAFAGEHVDVCAMALIMLEWARPSVPVTPAMVKERVRVGYPWLFEEAS